MYIYMSIFHIFQEAEAPEEIQYAPLPREKKMKNKKVSSSQCNARHYLEINTPRQFQCPVVPTWHLHCAHSSGTALPSLMMFLACHLVSAEDWLQCYLLRGTALSSLSKTVLSLHQIPSNL